ncbi:efflux RND transporter permease subunit [Klebsiella pneumoniae]|uniref:efflux RND transporter permease subunit n=1 Tax=Klebsiella pneumoniae TaxID=573 RepID=UPI003EE04D84
MLSILIFITGLIANPLLPVSEYPDVVPPSVQVRAEYPGANPKVIAVRAAQEKAVKRTENPAKQTIDQPGREVFLRAVRL